MTGRRCPLLLAVVIVTALVGCKGGGGDTTANPLSPTSTETGTGTAAGSGSGSDAGTGSGTGGTGTPTTPTVASVPTGLSMPFRVDDINLRGIINPFGIVRSSLDRGAVGHPGMDIPMNTGAPIFAVGGGTIVSVRPSIDSRPGSLVKLLLAADSTPGEGWTFLYEHVTLIGGLGEGSLVTRGQQIATNTMDPSFGNHLELSHSFNNYEFVDNQTCWVDQLDGAARSDFDNRFNPPLRTHQRFIDAWTTVTFVGGLRFRDLLTTTRYPDGARQCYPRGTDVRVDP